MFVVASDGPHVIEGPCSVVASWWLPTFPPPTPAKIKAYELRSNKKEGMLKKLEELKNELGQVRLLRVDH